MTILPRLLVGAAAAVALTFVPAAADTAQAAPAPGAMERALIAEMNSVRKERSRPPLRRNVKLTRVARSHSRSLQRRGVLTHDGRKGAPFWTRIVAAGFGRDRTMAENIAMVPGCGRAAARRVVRMWMNSPGHRANLLNRRVRMAGAGVGCNRSSGLAIVTADYIS